MIKAGILEIKVVRDALQNAAPVTGCLLKRPPKTPDRAYPWLRTRSMPMPMTGNIDRVEVITSVQRRRRWSAEEKARIVQETFAPGMSVSLVARQHGVAPNQLFTWRRLYAKGALLAVGAGR